MTEEQMHREILEQMRIDTRINAIIATAQIATALFIVFKLVKTIG